MDSYGFFAKLFENNTDDKLIKALDDGLDFELEDKSHKINFYTAALSIGSPDVVRACIRNGANTFIADDIYLYRPFPAVSTINIALTHRRPDVLEVLLSEGATLKPLFKKGAAWNLRNNLCPETSENLKNCEHERFTGFKSSLDKGTEILQVLRKHNIHIPALDDDYDSASFFNIDYNADILDRNLPLPEREINSFFELSVDGEGLPCPMPCQGTRKKALWHYATPEAMKEALKTQNPDVRDKAGWTALHHIAMYGNTDYYFKPESIAQVLISAGADVNTVNKINISPLMITCAKAFISEKMFEVVKILLRNGADDKSRDKSGRNARRWLLGGGAYRYGFQITMITEIFNEIIKSVKGIGLADVDLDLLVKVLWGTPKDIELDLSRGADINLHSEFDCTPLMMAAVFNTSEAVKCLLEHGADVSVKNYEGETALSLAAKASNIENMSLIIEHGGDFNALRWIDRNFYTKCTQEAEGFKASQEAPEIAELRSFGLEI